MPTMKTLLLKEGGDFVFDVGRAWDALVLATPGATKRATKVEKRSPRSCSIHV